MSKQVMALLDLGNTRYKWTYRDVSLAERIDARIYPQEQVMASIVSDVLSGSPVNLLLVCSVKDATFNHGLEAAFQRAGVQVRYAAIPPQLPFPLGYENPATLGVDRYCNLMAVYASDHAPSIIVSAGTAVTIDAMNSAAGHLGGVILPGLGLQRKSLNQSATLLNAKHFDVPQVFGNSTERAIAGGTLFGLVAAITSLVANMREKLGPGTQVIMTGGDAMLLSQYLPEDYRVDEFLLFKGLGQVL